MARSRTVTWAAALFGVGFLVCLVSFVSPHWLESDGKLSPAKFVRLGLWEVCFDKFEDPRHWYRTEFRSCWWVFEEEYYIIHDFLLPGFYVATQFFFTVGVTLCLAALVAAGVYRAAEGSDERYVALLLTLGSLTLCAAACALISVVTFGVRGDGRDWMPHWEHNRLGWAYAFGAVGALTLLPAGVLFLVEARVNRYRRLNELHSRDRSAYDLHERKSAHTDI